MGYLAAGPRIGLTAGVYDGHFTVTQTGGSGVQPLVEVPGSSSLGSNIVLASKGLLWRRISRTVSQRASHFQFRPPAARPIETRAYVTGRATVEVG